jgi:hypothetical protein
MCEPCPEGAIGCTVGVIHVPGGILFFKNRDMAGEYLANRLTIWHSTPHVHALGGTDLETGAPQGISIGVNRHRICVANTHVVSTPDVTYDLLCESLLHAVQQPGDVPTVVEAFLAEHPVQGGRILISSPTWTFLVEVFVDRFEMREMAGSRAITNTFSLLSYEAEVPAIRDRSSAIRLQVATTLVQTITTVGQLKSMLRSHIPEQGELSICNHRRDGGGTESSHIIHIQGDYVTWSSLTGYPCENDYHTTPWYVG